MPESNDSAYDKSIVNSLVIPDSFLADLAALTSVKVSEAVFDKIELVMLFPFMGSEIVPNTLKSRYGDKVRKLVVSSFDIFYTFDGETGTLEIKALVHQRAVR